MTSPGGPAQADADGELTPTSFPAWRHLVDVVHDPPGRRGDVRPAQALQEGGADKAQVNVPHAGFNEPAELELMAALGNLHRARLARPIVHVPEQVPVDGAKLGEVEATGWDAFGGPLGDKPPFQAVKLRHVSEAQLVPQDCRAGDRCRDRPRSRRRQLGGRGKDVGAAALV